MNIPVLVLTLIFLLSSLRFQRASRGVTVTIGAIGAIDEDATGDDLGNRLIPTSKKTDKPMNKNSCRALINVILLNTLLPPTFKNLMKNHP